jgi:hypothetical protein
MVAWKLVSSGEDESLDEGKSKKVDENRKGKIGEIEEFYRNLN